MISKRDIINLIKSKSDKIKVYRQEIKHGNQQTLKLMIQSICQLINQKNISDKKFALGQAHQLAVSADPKSVTAIYQTIVPKIIKDNTSQFAYQYLKAWTLMYNGKNNVLLYPNFSIFNQNVSKTNTNQELLSRYEQFEKNVNKKNEQKVEFFEDSIITQTEIDEQSRVIQTATLNIAEIQKIRQKFWKQNVNVNQIEQYKNKVIHFKQQNYKIRQIGLSSLEDGESIQKINQKLQQSNKWCQNYLKQYQKLRRKQIGVQKFIQQSKGNQNLQFSSNITFVPLNKQDFTIPNQIKKLGMVRQTNNSQKDSKIFINQQFKEFDNKQSRSKLKNVDQTIYKQNLDESSERLNYSRKNFNFDQSILKPQLIVTKYKPQTAKIPELSTSKERKRIFNSPPNSKNKMNYQTEQKFVYKSPINQYINKSNNFKLSDFTNQKQKRKYEANLTEFDRAPDWITTPFAVNFRNYTEFSRFRKTCLINKGQLCNDHKNIEVVYAIQRESSDRLSIKIKYINLSRQQKQLKTIYKIGKSFQVIDQKGVNAKFILKNQQIHSFTLKIKQFPLNVCFLQLSVGSRLDRISCMIALPITLVKFMTFEYMQKDDWIYEWNRFSRQQFYMISKKVQYHKKILSISQMTFLFPEFIQLGRKMNYSYQQFGCKCRYQYYSLQFLILFAFNVDNILTIQILCCHEVTEAESEFINYFVSIIIMLIQKLEIQ